MAVVRFVVIGRGPSQRQFGSVVQNGVIPPFRQMGLDVVVEQAE